ncbi:hypothetical protein ABKN59_010416 [Abortiporus biennis]
MPPLTLPPQVQVSIIDPLDSFNRVHLVCQCIPPGETKHLTRIQYWNVTLNAKEVKSSNQRHVTLVFRLLEKMRLWCSSILVQISLLTTSPKRAPSYQLILKLNSKLIEVWSRHYSYFHSHWNPNFHTHCSDMKQVETRPIILDSTFKTFQVALFHLRMDCSVWKSLVQYSFRESKHSICRMDLRVSAMDCDRASRATQYQMKHGSLESENSCCGCLKVVAETTPHFLLIRSCIISSAFPLDHINHCDEPLVHTSRVELFLWLLESATQTVLMRMIGKNLKCHSLPNSN